MGPEHTTRVGDDAAARWFARLRAPGCSTVEQRAFRAWLEADPAHPAAYQRAMSTALKLSASLKSDPELKAMLDAALDDKAAVGSRARDLLPRVWTRRLLPGALALLCALAVGPYLRDDSTAAPTERLLVNDGTERREVRLEDGSVVLLDVGAEVSVQMLEDARRLRLVAGRAYFQVAHDKTRPFTVAAGGTLTTALGTRFEVDMRSDATAVTLAEGSVAVAAAGNAAAWSRRLVPGEQLVSRRESAPFTQAVDVAQTLGWSTGHLHFQGVALRDVVAEWNQYARVRITVGDTSLADARIVGTFEAGGDSGEFVTALATVLPIRSLPVGAKEILLVRDY
jgi:transmembrane sensor